MKISYKKYAPLQWIKDGKANIPFRKGYNEPTKQIISASFAEKLPDFGTDVKYISTPVFLACQKNLDKLGEVLGKGDSFDEFGFGVVVNVTMTIFYDFRTPDYPTVFAFFNSGTPYWLIHNGLALIEPSVLTPEEQQTYDNKTECLLRLRDLTLLLLFIKYAETETKVLEANRKTPDVKCDYGAALNETGLDVTYITATWFTNLVKTEGFAVRGHFRWQAYGEGMKQRKLIWVDAFEKSGYSRQADIMRQ